MTSFKSKLTLFFISIFSLGLIACTEQSDDRKFISEKNDSAVPVMLQAKGARSATFYVKEMSAANPQILEYNELGFPRVKEYDITVCLADKATLSGFYGRPFDVSDGMTDRTITADDSGCLRWKESYSFDFFAPEKFIKFTRTIKGRNGIHGAVEIEIALNPWTDDFYDLRYNPVATVPNSLTNTPFNGQLKAAMTIPPEDAAQIKQDSISLSYLGIAHNQFKIDEKLNVSFTYRFNLEFNPEIYRRALNSVYDSVSADVGKVKLTVIFLREREANPNLADYENYINHFTGTFDIVTGRVRQIIELPFSQLDAIDVRIRALVAVEPVVTSSNVRPAYFEGILGPLPGSASIELWPTKEYNVDAVLADFLKTESSNVYAQMAPLEILRAQDDVQYFTVSDLANMPLWNQFPENYQIDEITTDYIGGRNMVMDPVLKSICATYENRGTEIEFWTSSHLCSNYFKLFEPTLLEAAQSGGGKRIYKYLSFVEKVDQTSVKKVDQTFVDEISLNLVKSRGTSMGTSLGANFGANLGLNGSINSDFDPIKKPADKNPLKIPLQIPYGFGGGLSAGIAFDSSAGISFRQNRNFSVSTGHSFSVDRLTFQFEVETRDCLYYELSDGESQTSRGLPSKTLVCNDTTTTRTATENYYYIRKAAQGSDLTTDKDSERENPIRFMIRGERMYNNFLSHLKQTKAGFLNLRKTGKYEGSLLIGPAKSWYDNEGFVRIMEIYSNTNQDFPGVLSLDI